MTSRLMYQLPVRPHRPRAVRGVLMVRGHLGSSATMAGLTGFLRAGRMESVGKEMRPECGWEEDILAALQIAAR